MACIAKQRVPISRLLTWLASSGTLLSLLAGIMVPVYSDETGWRFQERAAIDGFDILFNDLCGPNTLARAPWFMMPVRWFSAVTNETFADPFFIRLEGIACALLVMLQLRLLLRRLEPDAERRRMLTAAAFALLGMGMLPYLLVWSRPEQPLMLTTLSILLIALSPSARMNPMWQAWMRVAAIVSLSVVAQSYHMKGVLYAVVATAAITVCAEGKGTRLPRIAGATALLFFASSSSLYWTARLNCPDNAALAAMYGRENIVALLANTHDPVDVVAQLLKNLNPFNYVMLVVPSDNPMSAWIPVNLFSPVLITVMATLLVMFWAAAGIGTLVALARFAFIRRLAALREPKFVLACAMLVVIEIWNLSQLNRNVYEAAHVLPMVIVAFLLSLTLPCTNREGSRLFERFAPLAVMLALIGQIALSATLIPALAHRLQKPGYIAGQPFSISIRNYRAVKRDIAVAMTASGMPAGRPLNRLLIDELTYLALQEHKLPLHRLGVFTVWNGGLSDPVEYLRRENSDGIVVGCHHLPKMLRVVAAHSGPICAVSRKALDRLAGV